MKIRNVSLHTLKKHRIQLAINLCLMNVLKEGGSGGGEDKKEKGRGWEGMMGGRKSGEEETNHGWSVKLG